MKHVLLASLFVLFSNAAVAQSSKKFDNTVIDKYISSVGDLVKKRGSLSRDLGQLEEKIAAAKKGSSSKDLKDLQKKADALDAAYKSLGNDAKKVARNSASASKESSKCGLKVADCLSGVKDASEALTKLSSDILPEVKRIAEAKLKLKSLKG